MVTLVKLNILWLAQMVELTVMACCKHFNTVAHEVTIKLHEKSTKSQVMWRNMSLQILVVAITE